MACNGYSPSHWVVNWVIERDNASVLQWKERAANERERERVANESESERESVMPLFH